MGLSFRSIYFSLYKRLSTMMMLLNILISSFQAREGFFRTTFSLFRHLKDRGLFETKSPRINFKSNFIDYHLPELTMLSRLGFSTGIRSIYSVLDQPSFVSEPWAIYPAKHKTNGKLFQFSFLTNQNLKPKLVGCILLLQCEKS